MQYCCVMDTSSSVLVVPKPSSTLHTGSSKVLDVGELEHTSPACNLKLRTSCTMKISSPVFHVFPFSSILQQISTLVSSRVWVARGTGLCMIVRLLFDDIDSHQFDRRTFFEGLSVLLCNAEVVLYPSLLLIDI